MKLECVCCSWGAQVLERLVMLEFVGLYLLVQELLMKLRSTQRKVPGQGPQNRASPSVSEAQSTRHTRTRPPTHKAPSLQYIAW